MPSVVLAAGRPGLRKKEGLLDCDGRNPIDLSRAGNIHGVFYVTARGRFSVRGFPPRLFTIPLFPPLPLPPPMRTRYRILRFSNVTDKGRNVREIVIRDDINWRRNAAGSPEACRTLQDYFEFSP